MDAKNEAARFSPALTEAVEYIRQIHTESRKGSSIPYLAHLFGVASLVMAETGGPVPVTEEMVVAALLHDVVEDHGGLPRLREVEERFGSTVARLVKALSDTMAEDGGPLESWEDRKRAYLARLPGEPLDVLLISAADKLYNAQAILDDYRHVGDALWERFHRGKQEQLWYFEELRTIFRAHLHSRSTEAFERVLDELQARA